MADKKISALTGATTPLAGTEVLPIVQGGATVKVAVSDLTAGRAVSVLSLTSTNDCTVDSLTVGKGSGTQTQNTALGVNALAATSSSNKNTTVGYNAGKAVTTGNGGNTLIGNEAGQAQTTSVYNTAVGNKAGYNATGSQNTFVGYQAGYSCTGTSNTFVGPQNDSSAYGSGELITSGNYNTVLGAFSGNQNSLDIRTASNYIVLSDGLGVPRAYNNGTDWVLPTGNLIIGTSGKGIDFSATAGTGTSELLSDYEEGTWTPTLGGTATYLAQTGSYTKVGRLVFVRGTLYINAIGTGTTNSLSGLPFTAADAPPITVQIGGSAQAFSAVYGYIATTNVNITYNAALAVSNQTAANVFTALTYIDFSGCYSV